LVYGSPVCEICGDEFEVQSIIKTSREENIPHWYCIKDYMAIKLKQKLLLEPLYHYLLEG
jgi:hypothetical protein